ncbi:MAG: heme-binding protein, partial [Bacteroidota bacterium]|nr:heme-binding protein [Bacteroidota bacterium]
KYKVLYSEGNFEIRFYPPSTTASYTVDGNYDTGRNKAFMKLYDYIVGENTTKRQIAMTSPVHIEEETHNRLIMRFVMPENMHFEEFPKPNENSIRILRSTSYYTASLRFGGFASQKKIKARIIELKKILDKRNIVYTDKYIFMGYDPPFKFFKRHNEIHLLVVPEHLPKEYNNN